MSKNVSLFLLVFVLSLTGAVSSVVAAYHHGGDTDSDLALQAYPRIEGTKLDSCALCHSGGEYEKKPGKFVELGSCQWCHYMYGYDQSGSIETTLNGYGRDYRDMGRNSSAFAKIDAFDSDGDGYVNRDEIGAVRYPGDDDDDPSKVPAPYRIVSMDELLEMESHSQFMLMNTHKSGDFYTEYRGVTMADLLDDSGVLQSATGLTVFAPDGFAQYHPLEEVDDPLMYPVFGIYPQAPFYYEQEADKNLTEYGWCDYSSPAAALWSAGESIEVENGLQMILAYARDGEFLQPGSLDTSNKLDGEGPFRVVPPQKNPGPPDQSSKSDMQDVIWPFDEEADHNAGYSSRSATILRIEPLPEGTTDLNILEAGWNYVDEGKVLLYGAIDPYETLQIKLAELRSMLRTVPADHYKTRQAGRLLSHQISILQRMLRKGVRQPVVRYLQELSMRVDGCGDGEAADHNDLIVECTSQNTVYWAINELQVLLAIR